MDNSGEMRGETIKQKKGRIGMTGRENCYATES